MILWGAALTAENATPDKASAPMKARSRVRAAAQTEGKCRRILAIGSSRTRRGLEAAPKCVKSNHGVKRQTEYQTSIVHFTRAWHGDDVVAGIDEVDLACHPFREARKQIDSGPANVFNCDRAPERRMVALKVEHEACVGDPGSSSPRMIMARIRAAARSCSPVRLSLSVFRPAPSSLFLRTLRLAGVSA